MCVVPVKNKVQHVIAHVNDDVENQIHRLFIVSVSIPLIMFSVNCHVALLHQPSVVLKLYIVV